MRRCAFALFMLVVGCGKSEQKADGSATIVGDGGGRYSQGVYSCCAKGEGISCCPPESLADPTSGRTATCFPYGGAYEDCVPEGGELEAKVICAFCCPGLTRLEKCGAPIPSLFVCGACGNGVCGLGETACNCPADCS